MNAIHQNHVVLHCTLTSLDDLPEELSYEIPFKAIYSLAEWANVAVNALSAANHVLNSIDNHDPYNSNAIEIQQSIIQLVET